MKLKIVSDGTNTGTHLVDADTGERIQQISKLSWEASADSLLTTTTVELINIPVEIIAKAEVDLLDIIRKSDVVINENTFDIVDSYGPFDSSKTFEKEIRITSEQNQGPGFVLLTKIYDTLTNKVVGAIQKIKWEATPGKREAKVTRIRFDKTDWV